MQKCQFYTTASSEKRLITYKQKKPFVYFNNELAEAANSSFCLSKNRAFLCVLFSKT